MERKKESVHGHPPPPGRPRGRPRGIDISGLSFRGLRENGAEYVDKSHFIETLIEDPSGAFLFPRPRRFGKSINMEMLYEFLPKRMHPPSTCLKACTSSRCRSLLDPISGAIRRS